MLGTGENFRRTQHRRRHRYLRQIVARLGIKNRDRADPNARVFKNSAANRHIGLRLGDIAARDVETRLEPQHRDRHRKRSHRRLIRHPRRIDSHFGEIHGAILRTDRQRQPGAEQSKKWFHR